MCGPLYDEGKSKQYEMNTQNTQQAAQVDNFQKQQENLDKAEKAKEAKDAQTEKAKETIVKKEDVELDNYRKVDLANDDLRNEHERNRGLGSVRETIVKFFTVSMNPYGAIDRLRALPDGEKDKRRSHVSKSRGASIKEEENGAPLLEFDLAGSGYRYFREFKDGIKKNEVTIGNETFNLSDYSKLTDEKKVKWYHQKLGGKLFGKKISTPEEVRIENEEKAKNMEEEIRNIEEKIEARKKTGETGEILALSKEQEKYKENQRKKKLIDDYLGASQYVNGVKRENVRKKQLGENNKHRVRYTLAGSLAIGGMANSGDYSIDKVAEYMLACGQDYVNNLVQSWKNEETTPQTSFIAIRGHSRGGVASGLGVKALKSWIKETHPYYAHYFKFDLTQYDPVPGVLPTSEKYKLKLLSKEKKPIEEVKYHLATSKLKKIAKVKEDVLKTAEAAVKNAESKVKELEGRSKWAKRKAASELEKARKRADVARKQTEVAQSEVKEAEIRDAEKEKSAELPATETTKKEKSADEKLGKQEMTEEELLKEEEELRQINILSLKAKLRAEEEHENFIKEGGKVLNSNQQTVKKEKNELDEGDSSTVVYSIHGDGIHNVGFKPQAVHGCNRIIITPQNHGVNLDRVTRNQDTKAMERGFYTDAATQMSYREGDYSNLPDGVYFVDEQNTLVRMDHNSQAQLIINEVVKGVPKTQKARHQVLREVIAKWFLDNDPD